MPGKEESANKDTNVEPEKCFENKQWGLGRSSQVYNYLLLLIL